MPPVDEPRPQDITCRGGLTLPPMAVTNNETEEN